MTKEQRAEINRRNAQKSTGPKTEEGKNRSRLNATRHNITGQVIVMYEKDLNAYTQFKQSFHDAYQPQGPVETQLVQCMVDASWKMNESTAWQTRILSGDSVSHVNNYPEDNNPQINEAFATASVVAKITKDLANMSLYEQRHFRTFERAHDRLVGLQEKRQQNERISLKEAAAILELHLYKELQRHEAYQQEAEKAAASGQPSPDPFIPTALVHESAPAQLLAGNSLRPEEVLVVNGFVFSTVNIKDHIRCKQQLEEALALRRTGPDVDDEDDGRD